MADGTDLAIDVGGPFLATGALAAAHWGIPDPGEPRGPERGDAGLAGGALGLSEDTCNEVSNVLLASYKGLTVGRATGHAIHQPNGYQLVARRYSEEVSGLAGVHAFQKLINARRPIGGQGSPSGHVFGAGSSAAHLITGNAPIGAKGSAAAGLGAMMVLRSCANKHYLDQELAAVVLVIFHNIMVDYLVYQQGVGRQSTETFDTPTKEIAYSLGGAVAAVGFYYLSQYLPDSFLSNFALLDLQGRPGLTFRSDHDWDKTLANFFR